MKFGGHQAGNRGFTVVGAAFLLFSGNRLIAETGHVLPGHVPPALVRLQPAAHLPAETNLYLCISLPLRNQPALTALIAELYEPANPKFRQWLTPDQFGAQFCPTESDYRKVIGFAESHGLRVVSKHPNRMLVDVTGSVANIENAFQVRLSLYQHPTENRMFYAPDIEPTVEPDIPILHIAGLPYSATTATNATDLNGDALAFAKVSGPVWLTVAPNGSLSGTPLLSDSGTNSFVVSLTDPGNLSSVATLNIPVIAAQPIVASVSLEGANVLLSWTGGTSPYQVQMDSDLTTTNWVGITGPISSNTIALTFTNGAAFYRILGH